MENYQAQMDAERRKPSIGTMQREAAKKHLLEGKLSDAEIMRITDISPYTLGQLRRRLKEAGDLPGQKQPQEAQAAEPQSEPVPTPTEAVSEAKRRPEEAPAWNAHICEGIPHDCCVARGSDGSAFFVIDGKRIGPINACPWCAAKF